MSMTLPVDAAASRLGGALNFVGAMTPQMPDFGAMPDSAAVESANAAAQSERMRKEQARQEAAQRRYRELVESGAIDENGLSKDGKMFRGPQARLFVAQNGGRDFVLKDKDLAAKLNKITIAENRALGGLDPLPEEPAQTSDDTLAAAYPRPENMPEPRYRQNLDILRQGKDAPPDLTKAALFELSPESTQFGQKQIEREEKRNRLQQKQQQAIDSYRDKMETGLRAIERMRRNIAEGFLPEVGLVGNALRQIPGTDAYELETDLESLKGIIGFEGLMDAKQQSPNGASGFGNLSNYELAMLQGLAGQLRQGGNKEGFLERLQDIERYLRKGLTPSPVSEAEIDAFSTPAAQSAQSERQSSAAPAEPRRFKFTSDGSLVGG